jgi:hypothetical protein
MRKGADRPKLPLAGPRGNAVGATAKMISPGTQPEHFALHPWGLDPGTPCRDEAQARINIVVRQSLLPSCSEGTSETRCHGRRVAMHVALRPLTRGSRHCKQRKCDRDIWRHTAVQSTQRGDPSLGISAALCRGTTLTEACKQRRLTPASTVGGELPRAGRALRPLRGIVRKRPLTPSQTRPLPEPCPLESGADRVFTGPRGGSIRSRYPP